MRRGTARVLLYKRPAVVAASSTTTLNPSDIAGDASLSNGNLTITHGGADADAGARSIASTSTAKKFWEVTVNVIGSPSITTNGFGNSSANLATYLGANANSVGWAGDGAVYLGADIGPGGGALAYTTGNVLGFAVDFNAELAWLRVNSGNWNNNGSANPATGTGGLDVSGLNAGPYFACVCVRVGSDQMTANFGATAYAHTAPSGFGNW
jgi:hypothetical protein